MTHQLFIKILKNPRFSFLFVKIFLVFCGTWAQAEKEETKIVSPSSTLVPLSENIRQIFMQVQPDQAPRALARNSNYVVSNENHQEQYYPVLQKQKGGVYLGVGVDQNYLMAAWSHPEVLVLFDFDQVVVNLHKVYRLFFLHAKTKEEFLAFWGTAPKTQNQIQTWIEEEYGEEDQQNPGKKKCLAACKPILHAYRISHKLVKSRLSFLAKKYSLLQIPSFVTDEESYQYLVALYKTNRVFFLRGDFSKSALCSVAEAMKAAKLSISNLYFSNAESYFSYASPSHFKECMAKVPTNANSLILHTWALKNTGNKYGYFVQSADFFKAWLEIPRITKFSKIVFADYYPLFHAWREKERIYGIKYPPPALISLEKLPKKPSNLVSSSKMPPKK